MKLSVVIPAYNEEKRIEATLRDVDSYLKKQAYDYEIVVVVNNSHDKTYDIVKNLEATAISKATAMNLPEGGKGNAVKRGILEKASGDVIVFMDADNATPISEIEKFLPYLQQGYDVVIGSRYTNPDLVKQKQPLYRVVLSRLSNVLIQFLAIPGIKDTQLGFKAFTKKAAKDIFPLVSILRWGFDMEVLTVALAHHYKIKEVGVQWTEYGGGHVPLKAYIESLIDLVKIKINNISGKYDPEHHVVTSEVHVTVKDYDLAGAAGLITGLCLMPTVWNIGIHNQNVIIALPIVMTVGMVFGVWLGKFLSKWIPIMFQLAKFAVVGILNTAINFGVLNLASVLTGITAGWAVGGYNIPATIVAAVNSYIWNKYWVFPTGEKKSSAKEVTSFVIVTAFGMALNSLIIVAFTDQLQPMFGLNHGAWLNIGKVAATIIVAVINFLGYKFLVFRRKAVKQA